MAFFRCFDLIWEKTAENPKECLAIQTVENTEIRKWVRIEIQLKLFEQ